MDSKSFKDIYDQYWREMYSYAVYYCKDKAVAEEIVQDIFLSLWHRHESFTALYSIKTYLFHATKNKIADFFRQKCRSQELIDNLYLEACNGSCFTEETVHFNELNNELQVTISSLPCRCREVYELSREQGLSNKEIASTLAISEKTVEQHMTKALGYIRKKIGLLYNSEN